MQETEFELMLTVTNNWEDVEDSLLDGDAVVYFTASWCQPCKLFKPEFVKASVKDTRDFREYFIVDIEEVDVRVIQDLQILSVPTIMAFPGECSGDPKRVIARKSDEIVTEVTTLLG
jgi:thioredoxin-like negative regulator of GroEL